MTFSNKQICSFRDTLNTLNGRTMSDLDYNHPDFTVIITGAGCSVDLGIPAMGTFMQRMWEIYTGDSTKEIREVFDFVRRLRTVYHNSYVDLNNVESVYSAVEMFNHISNTELSHRMLETFQRMICNVIERSCKLDRTDRFREPTSRYRSLLEGIGKDRLVSRRTVFLTTNYDVLLEAAITRLHLSYGEGSDCTVPRFYPYYGFEGIEVVPEGYNPVNVYKLHGSINWYKSNEVLKAKSLFDLFRAPSHSTDYSYLREFEDGFQFNFTKEFDRNHSKPAIVPPTFSKDSKMSEMREVWKMAAKALSCAKRVVVIGYSVPETDLMFRYLYAVATLEMDWSKGVYVINKDGSIREHYIKFLGQTGIHNSEFLFEHFNALSISRMNAWLDGTKM